MGIFGKRLKNRKFDYIPRFYDADKEKLKERLQNYDEDEKGNPELMKQRIKSGFKTRGRKIEPEFRTKQVKRSNLIILIILAVLIFISYILLCLQKSQRQNGK